MAHLPRTIHFVAEAPVADVVWRVVPVRSPQLAPLRALVHVAVFNVGDGRLRRAGAKVECQERFGAHQLAPVDELVRAELIGLERIPCALQHGRALLLRSDAIEPVVAGHEVAARIAHHRHAHSLHFGDDIRTESVGVRARRSGLVHARVDRPAEMFQERAEQAAIELRAGARLEDHGARRAATDLRVSDALQPGRGGEQRARLAQP